MSTLVGILNAHMFNQSTEPGEHVDWSRPDLLTAEEWADLDWSRPDILTAEEWADLLGMPVDMYAGYSPHMIVFEVSR